MLFPYLVRTACDITMHDCSYKLQDKTVSKTMHGHAHLIVTELAIGPGTQPDNANLHYTLYCCSMYSHNFHSTVPESICMHASMKEYQAVPVHAPPVAIRSGMHAGIGSAKTMILCQACTVPGSAIICSVRQCYNAVSGKCQACSVRQCYNAVSSSAIMQCQAVQCLAVL